MSSNGNIDCSAGDKWFIHNDGTASFGKLSINNGSISMPGITINGDTLSSLTAQIADIQGQLNAQQVQIGGLPAATQNYARNQANGAESSSKSYVDEKFSGAIDGTIKEMGFASNASFIGSSYTFTNGLLTNITPLGGYAFADCFDNTFKALGGIDYEDVFRAGEMGFGNDIRLRFKNGLLVYSNKEEK